MPEGPEVQHVLRALKPHVVGATIDRFRSLHHCFRDVPTPLVVRDAHRHGKWMVLDCGDAGLMLNLGMSGILVLGGPLRRNVRWVAMLDRPEGRTLLQFVDPRCMGRLRLLDAPLTRIATRGSACSLGCPEIGLGPDAMGRALGDADQSRVQARWRTILAVPFELKRALMMQHLVAGLGNIYAAEACWHARASPTRPANTLTRRQVALLAESVPAMLKRSLSLGGTSFGDVNTFRGLDAAEGTGSTVLRVYGREGLPCRRCGTSISRMRQYGRSTYWCATCQE